MEIKIHKQQKIVAKLRAHARYLNREENKLERDLISAQRKLESVRQSQLHVDKEMEKEQAALKNLLERYKTTFPGQEAPKEPLVHMETNWQRLSTEDKKLFLQRHDQPVQSVQVGSSAL